VIDVLSRRIVGWRASNSLRSNLTLDELEQAPLDRRFSASEWLVQQRDCGVQRRSIRHTDRAAETR